MDPPLGVSDERPLLSPLLHHLSASFSEDEGRTPGRRSCSLSSLSPTSLIMISSRLKKKNDKRWTAIHSFLLVHVSHSASSCFGILWQTIAPLRLVWGIAADSIMNSGDGMCLVDETGARDKDVSGVHTMPIRQSEQQSGSPARLLGVTVS